MKWTGGLLRLLVLVVAMLLPHSTNGWVAPLSAGTRTTCNSPTTTTTATTIRTTATRRILATMNPIRNNQLHHRHSHPHPHSPVPTLAPTPLGSTAIPQDGNNDDDDDDEAQRQRQPQQQTKKEQRQQRRRRLSVSAILASSFLNLLGFTMAGPITPALGHHFGLQVGASFGSLTSAYPFGMLFGLFLWPSLSDSIGRKPVMTASLLGSGLGLAAQSQVIRCNGSLAWFLAARAVTGAFAGSSPVSKAFLADIGYKDGKLPRYLALRDAASTMAFIVGPLLGGILYDLRQRFMMTTTATTGPDATRRLVQQHLDPAAPDLAFVIAVSAAASLVAALLVGALVQNRAVTSKHKKGGAPDVNSSSSDDDYDDDDQEKEELISCPLGNRMWSGVASVCVVSFLFNVGDSTFHAFFSALLRDGAGVGPGNIGLLYTLLACISFVVSTTGTSRIMKAIGPVLTCAAGLSCIGTGLLAFGLAASSKLALFQPRFSVLAASAAIYYCGVPLYGPTIPTMLLRCVPSHRRGAIMGLDGTINTIARIISPLVMGDVYRRYGAGASFGLAGVAVFGGVATTLVRRFVVLNAMDSTTSTT
jgi:DHA1 family tetracycline resistance protein-like MFS transporter